MKEEGAASNSPATMTGGEEDTLEEQQPVTADLEATGLTRGSTAAAAGETAGETAPGTPVNGLGGDGGRRTGKCKWFNVLKGFGFITPHDGSQDIFVHQSVIQMTGFRSLGEGEEVEFECKPSDKGIEATFVSGPQSSDCKGSDRRPMGKKKYKKIRCYNCGDFGNHIAAKCPHGPLPKRCHFCKAEDHLIADCPHRDPNKSQRDSDSGADTPGPGSSNNGFGSGGEGSGGPDDNGSGTDGSAAVPAASTTTVAS